jgi:hypothetical protein
MRARNNNRAETVEDTFHEGRRKYGTPHRVRGDHGCENLRVAEWQFRRHGLNSGAYIWGRFVHVRVVDFRILMAATGAYTIRALSVCGWTSRRHSEASGKHYSWS